ncbi:hypothetical protein CP8484711_0977B, partial [Chlamydia psittaci 84-8471/1]
RVAHYLFLGNFQRDSTH